MSNLLKAEFYKLFHSWYFWGIGLFNLLLSSVLLLDSVGETSNLFFASIYNMPILYFLTIIFSALFVGNDFGRRTLQSYINAGHRRGKILFAKLVVHQIACIGKHRHSCNGDCFAICNVPITFFLCLHFP